MILFLPKFMTRSFLLLSLKARSEFKRTNIGRRVDEPKTLTTKTWAISSFITWRYTRSQRQKKEVSLAYYKRTKHKYIRNFESCSWLVFCMCVCHEVQEREFIVMLLPHVVKWFQNFSRSSFSSFFLRVEVAEVMTYLYPLRLLNQWSQVSEKDAKNCLLFKIV